MYVCGENGEMHSNHLKIISHVQCVCAAGEKKNYKVAVASTLRMNEEVVIENRTIMQKLSKHKTRNQVEITSRRAGMCYEES